MAIFHRDPKCTRCRRPLLASGKCPMCSAVVRGHQTGRNAVKVESRACLDGVVRVHRNGICAGPC